MHSKNVSAALILMVSCLYILLLSFNNKLNYYIDSRYVVFTVVMAVICFGLLMAYFLSHRNTVIGRIQLLSVTPLLIVLVLGIGLPARSLTSSTVSQRFVLNQVPAQTGNQSLNAVLFSQSSRALSLSDWSRVLSVNNNESYYVGKPVDISGFVYDAGLGPDTFLLARFVVTCCAVDAQPVGVPVHIRGWSQSYDEDQWLRIEGQFKAEHAIVLTPEVVEKIEEPERPYAD